MKMSQTMTAIALCETRLYFQVMIGCLSSPTTSTIKRRLVGIITYWAELVLAISAATGR